MFLGHYGVAFGGKTIARKPSLGTFILAAQLADLVWPILLLAAVVSHWFLDLLVHRPDLPVWPGGPKLGFGMWNSVVLTLLAEALVFGGGLVLYLRATTAKDRIGNWALWSLVALLVATYAAASLETPPADSGPVAGSALVLWLFVPWGYWIDRHRQLRE